MQLLNCMKQSCHGAGVELHETKLAVMVQVLNCMKQSCHSAGAELHEVMLS